MRENDEVQTVYTAEEVERIVAEATAKAKYELAEQYAEIMAGAEESTATEASNKVGISVVCTRPGELDTASKDVRKFIRAMQKEMNGDVSFDMNVVVNPHGVDHDRPKKRMGFTVTVDDEEVVV